MEEPAEPEVDSLASEAVMKPLPVFILKVPVAWSQDVPVVDVISSPTFYPLIPLVSRVCFDHRDHSWAHSVQVQEPVQPKSTLSTDDFLMDMDWRLGAWPWYTRTPSYTPMFGPAHMLGRREKTVETACVNCGSLSHTMPYRIHMAVLKGKCLNSLQLQIIENPRRRGSRSPKVCNVGSKWKS